MEAAKFKEHASGLKTVKENSRCHSQLHFNTSVKYSLKYANNVAGGS